MSEVLSTRTDSGYWPWSSKTTHVCASDPYAFILRLRRMSALTCCIAVRESNDERQFRAASLVLGLS